MQIFPLGEKQDNVFYSIIRPISNWSAELLKNKICDLAVNKYLPHLMLIDQRLLMPEKIMTGLKN